MVDSLLYETLHQDFEYLKDRLAEEKQKRREAVKEHQAALEVVMAARHWQRAWETRRQRTGHCTADEENLSRFLDQYFAYRTRYDGPEAG